MWMLELNQVPLQEQIVLLTTELSLQPQAVNFYLMMKQQRH